MLQWGMASFYPLVIDNALLVDDVPDNIKTMPCQSCTFLSLLFFVCTFISVSILFFFLVDNNYFLFNIPTYIPSTFLNIYWHLSAQVLYNYLNMEKQDVFT